MVETGTQWKNRECCEVNVDLRIRHGQIECNAVSLLVRYRICDSQVASSSPEWAPPRSGLGQATYTCMPLSPSSIIWYRPRGVISLAGKVTAGLAESNGSLPLGL